MKILITGDKGFIGAHLTNYFNYKGVKYEGLDLKDGKDVCDVEPSDISHIFHLAASKSVPLSMKRPEEFIHNNCLGTVKLMQAFPKARILNISSSSANEVKSIYGATKLFGEQIGNFHKNWLNARLYNVFGEGQPEGAVVSNFIKCRLNSTRPIIFGDGSQERDMTYVGDVVNELVGLMFDTWKTGLTHVGYSDPITVLNLCQYICQDLEPIHEPQRSFDIVYSKSPISMKVKYGRTEGLERTISWYENSLSRNSA